MFGIEPSEIRGHTKNLLKRAGLGRESLRAWQIDIIPRDKSVCQALFLCSFLGNVYLFPERKYREHMARVHCWISVIISQISKIYIIRLNSAYQTPDKYEKMFYLYNPNRTYIVQQEKEN